MSEKERYNLIWAAAITPAAAKLVTLAMANYGKGTNIFVSVATIARHCGLSAKQTRRHIHDLMQSGILVATATPERATHTYRLDFPTLLALRSTPVDGSTPTPVDGSSQTPIYSRGCPDLLPPAGAYPNDPDVSQGREGSVPSGSAAARPPRGPAPQLANCPEWVDMAALQLVGETGLPGRKRDVGALVQSAIALHAAGTTPEAINAALVEMGTTGIHKLILQVALPKAPAKAYGRTTARTKASVAPSVDNTRTPGRYDSMKARAYHAN